MIRVCSRERTREREVSNLGNDKLVGEETNGGQCTIHEKRDGGDWVDGCVHICKPLEKFQPSVVTIPYRTMPTKENLN